MLRKFIEVRAGISYVQGYAWPTVVWRMVRYFRLVLCRHEIILIHIFVCAMYEVRVWRSESAGGTAVEGVRADGAVRIDFPLSAVVWIFQNNDVDIVPSQSRGPSCEEARRAPAKMACTRIRYAHNVTESSTMAPPPPKPTIVVNGGFVTLRLEKGHHDNKRLHTAVSLVCMPRLSKSGSGSGR